MSKPVKNQATNWSSDDYDPAVDNVFTDAELKEILKEHEEASKGMPGPDEWDLDSALGKG